MSSFTLPLSWVKTVLAALALGLALAVPGPALADDTAETVLSIINVARKQAGCAPLKLNTKLMKAARIHASAMAEKDFFGHKGKDGAKPGTRAKRQGYSYHMVAENIAAGLTSASQAANGWLASSGHRRNILNCKLKDTGIAVAYQADDEPMDGNTKPYYYYWVQIFGAP